MSQAVDRPRFARFDTAMAAAHDAGAPQFVLYDETVAAANAPAARQAAPWQPLRRPLVRRVGIGGGVMLAAVLLATALTAPLGAALDWLTGGPDRPLEQTVASPADVVPLTPAVDGDERPALASALPVLTQDASATAAQSAPPAAERVTRVTALDAATRPLARPLPLPSFKPSAADP